MTSRSVLYCATSYRRLPSFSPQKCSRRWLSELASKSSVPKKTKKAIAAEPVGGPKRGPGRPPKSKAYDSSEKKSEEVLPKVVGWDLPPLDLWRKYFPLDKSSLHRSVIRNPDTAAMLADAFVPEGSKDKIIIDACPGPGQLTRALLKLPKERIQKIIVLESSKSYLKYLKPLEDLDSRVTVYPWHGKDWDAYTKLREIGALDGVKEIDWNEVHPQLQFIIHMHTSVDGEQLLSQLFRCVPDRQWLFRYGRVPLHFILATRMWERLTAREGTSARCKLSIISQSSTDLKECVKPNTLQPYSHHFHPDTLLSPATSHKNTRGLDPRRVGTPHVAVSAVPLPNQLIRQGDLDTWDYVLRKLFVLSATSIEKCLNINALGPGSSNLIPRLTDPSRIPFDLKKNPKDLTVPEWELIIEEFKRWPFKPEELGIDAFYEINNHNR